MGPDNPWSPSWRPDESGRRLATIRAARLGALAAAIVYIPLGALAPMADEVPQGVAAFLLALGLPGVALLGAGLAPATLGSRMEALAAGIAFGIGGPVAAVTSVVIGAVILGAFLRVDLAGPLLRAGESASIAIAPLVGIGAGVWAIAVRRFGRARTKGIPSAS
jgi:hypothetical protein